MGVVTIIFAAFAVIGIIDGVLGNRFGLGAEFERGLRLIGTLTLSMLGMICLVPLISSLLEPLIIPMSEFLHIDASVFPSMLIANDMGGAKLSEALALNSQVGTFNALVVSSMMGGTISFTIPTALKMIAPEYHKDVMLGLLCGIATIPVGCFVGGLVAGVNVIALLINLIPLIIFSAIMIVGILKAPRFSVKAMTLFGKFLYALIMFGLALGIFEFLTGIVVIDALAPVKDSFELLFNLAFILSGVFPLLKIVSALLRRPLAALAKRVGINETSAIGIVSTLANSMPTFDMVKDMDRKGILLNMAFSVSAAFVIGDHLAFTMMYNSSYMPAVVVGKLVGGVFSLILACVVYKRTVKKGQQL